MPNCYSSAIPRLVAIDGPLKGSSFELSGEEFSIGRHSSNSLPVSFDHSASRRHCLIRRDGERFVVEDRDSHNGTFLNGVPVRARALEDGDQLAIGRSVFVFLMEAQNAAANGERASAPPGADPTPSLSLTRTEAAHLVGSAGMERSRAERDLGTLLAVSAAVASVRAVRPLAERLTRLLVETIPARTSAIALWDSGELTSIGWDRRREAVITPAPAPALVEKVLTRDAAVLFDEPSRLIAAPLNLFGNPLGLIWLESDDGAIRFDERDLRLLTTVGEITSLALNEARRTEGLVSENRRLRTELTARHRMVGESPAMRRVYDSISRIAPLDSTVLITGESGAGKELAARALHENSGRRDRPFVAINCAVLTDTLLETELFGHERGAFTGAVAQKKGKLEAAEGGTVFLDEVGELAGPIQAKLLRVLQEREFERVGGVRPIKLDVRLVAATNGDLAEAVRHQRFRADLFFRLNVISIAIPPLRDRREDIPLLANYFRVLHSERVKRRVTGISAQTHAKLLAYVWPGNVRELGSAIESAVALGSTELILPEDLPEAVLQAPTAEPSSHFNRALIETKKRLIEEAYQQAGGDYVRAARLLGLHPNSLLRLVRTLDLKGAVLH